MTDPNDPGDHDPRYLEGIRHFNACEFYEAHEVWEDLWAEQSGPSRKFLQGLIQVAVALHHFGNGNVRGARKLYRSSTAYLEPYRPAHLGIDLDQFLAALRDCFAELLASDAEVPDVQLDAEKIPDIELVDPPG